MRNATADYAAYRRRALLHAKATARTYEHEKKKVVNLFVYSTLKCIQGGVQKKRNGYVAAYSFGIPNTKHTPTTVSIMA